MQKLIHHIRRQPEEIKRHILHAFTLVAGIILILLWIYSLGVNLTSESTQTKMKKDLQPFSGLKANVIDNYNNMTGSDSNIQQ